MNFSFSKMTLEEKLDVMGINNNLESTNGDVYTKGGLPKADNLLVLLVQGLQSNDSKTLNVGHFQIRDIFKNERLFLSGKILLIFESMCCSTRTKK